MVVVTLLVCAIVIVLVELVLGDHNIRRSRLYLHHNGACDYFQFPSVKITTLYQNMVVVTLLVCGIVIVIVALVLGDQNMRRSRIY